MRRKRPPITQRPTPFSPPTREQIERARQMYREGFTVSRIIAACDMSLGTLYYWLNGGPLEAEGPLYPALPRRRVILGKRRRLMPADRTSLAARLLRTTERQVRDIEERLARGVASGPERERDVRMLTALVRAMRDLDAFTGLGHGGDAAPGEPDDDTPRNVDELRAELARRVEILRARRAAQEAEEKGGA